MAINKKIPPPKTSPQKYASTYSKSPVEECNLERPILLKKAENAIMIVTSAQPLS